jgi:hypothetical protein
MMWLPPRPVLVGRGGQVETMPAVAVGDCGHPRVCPLSALGALLDAQ